MKSRSCKSMKSTSSKPVEGSERRDSAETRQELQRRPMGLSRLESVELSESELLDTLAASHPAPVTLPVVCHPSCLQGQGTTWGTVKVVEGVMS